MDKFDWLMAGIAVGVIVGAGVCVALMARHGHVTLGMRGAARLTDALERAEWEDRWENEGGR